MFFFCMNFPYLYGLPHELSACECKFWAYFSQIKREVSGECWQRFKSRFNEIVRDVIRFAKKIPSFSDLDIEDQVNLIKGGCFEVKHQMKLLQYFSSSDLRFSCIDFCLLVNEIIKRNTCA